MEFYGRLEYPVTMVLSLRVATVESNGEQSEEDNDFLDHLRSFEKENLRVITAVEIQNLELEHKKLVINYFVYHEQIGLVADYENSFLELKRRAQVWNKGKFDEKWVVSILVRGQKEEIKDYVKLCCPDSLHRAIVLAKWRELCVTNKVFYERAKRDTSQDRLQLGKLIEEAKVTRNNGKEAAEESATNYVKDDIGYLISFNIVDNLSIVSIKLDKQAFDAKQKNSAFEEKSIWKLFINLSGY